MDIPVEEEIPLGIMLVFGGGMKVNQGPNHHPCKSLAIIFYHIGNYQNKFQKVSKTKIPSEHSKVKCA